MPTPHWVGANNGTWSTPSNWSLTKDGAGNGAVPGTGDTVYLDKTHTGALNINVNQNIGNIAELRAEGSNGNFYMGGSSAGVIGTTWSLSAPVTIYVQNGSYIGFNGGISGGQTITKTGAGFFGSDAPGAVTYGTSPINLNEGGLFAGVTNRLGTGKITMQEGTTLQTNMSSGSYSIQNPVDVRGSVYLGGGAATFGLTGTVDLDSTTRTLIVSTPVTISGPITGTAGFTKAGAGDLTINGATKELSGTITNNQANIIVNSGATGAATQLSNVTGFALTGGFIALGNAATSFASAFSGTGIIQVNLGSAQTTYSGDFSGFTGYVSSYTPSNITVPIVFSTNASFPAQGNTFSDIPGNAVTATFIWRYSGAGAVSTTGRNTSVFRNSNGNSSLTTEFDNASSSGALVTYGGEFGPIPAPFTTFTGGTHTVRFNASLGDIAVTGNIVTGGVTTRAVTKTGAFKATLSGANTYTGATTVSAGVLAIGHASGLGASSGAVSVASGATLELSTAGTTTYNKSSGILTLDGAGATVGGVAQGALRCAQSNSVSTYQALNLALANNTTIHVEGAILTLSTTNAWTGAFGLTLKGGGTVNSSATATGHAFTSLDIQNGEYYVTGALNNVSSNGQLGNSATAAGLKIGSATTTGLLGWSGSIAANTNKPWQIGTFGSFIRANGTSGATLTLSGTPTFSNVDTDCTFTLCGTGATAATPNVMSSNFGNNGTGKVTLSKIEAGHWRVSGTVTCDKVSVAGGSLGFNGNNYANNVELSGTGVLRDVVLTGNGTKAITCASGTPEIVTKAATNNTCTAPVTVSTAGTILKLTTDMSPLTTDQGKVLGNSPVTVNAGAGLRTGDSASQRGQARYGGTVTFKPGSRLYIGG